MKPTRRDLLKVGLNALPVVCIGSSLPAFVSRFAHAQTQPSTQVSDDFASSLLSKMLGEELGKSIEWDLVHPVIQIDVICTRHNQQLLRFRSDLVDVLGVVTRMRVFTDYQQNRSW